MLQSVKKGIYSYTYADREVQGHGNGSKVCRSERQARPGDKMLEVGERAHYSRK